MPYTGTGTVGGQAGHIIPPYYAEFMTQRLWPNLYFRAIGNRVTIPRGNGQKVRIPRWTSPLTNRAGVTQISAFATNQTAICANLQGAGLAEQDGAPYSTVKALSAASITGQVIQYGGVRGYTDRLMIVSRGNYIEGALQSLARELSFRIDRAIRLGISANAVVRSAGTAAGARSADALYSKALARIPTYFDGATVPRFDGDYFALITNPIAQFDFLSDISANGYTQVSSYQNSDRIYKGEVGKMYGVRIVLSSAVPRQLGGGATLSSTVGLSAGATGVGAFAFAEDAFWNIELQGGGLEVIHQPLGSGGATSDPLALRGTVGVKLYHGIAVSPQSEARIMRFGHGASLRY